MCWSVNFGAVGRAGFSAIQRPRLREKDGGEAGLESYQLFQQEGRMQGAVARKLLRQVSTRNYAGSARGTIRLFLYLGDDDFANNRLTVWNK